MPLASSTPSFAATKPTNTKIVDVSTGSVSVTWQEKNTGDVVYTILVSLSSAPVTANVVSSVTYRDVASLSTKIATVTASGLNPNTSYYASVNAAKAGTQTSDFSSPSRKATLANAPEPSLLAVYVSSLTVGWQESEGGTSGYRLDVSSFSNFESSITSTTKNSSLVILSARNLDAETTYYVRLASLNPDQVLNYSPVVLTTQTMPLVVPLLPAPEKPTLTTIVSVTTDSVRVSWKEKNAGSLSYIVAASTDSANLTGSVISSTTVNDLNSDVNKIMQASIYQLQPNTVYNVWVQALKDGALPGDTSSPDQGATLAYAVEPAIKNVFVSSVSVAWALPLGGSSGFRVEASTDSYFSSFDSSATRNPSATSLAVTGLIEATSYYFRVATLNWDEVPNYSFVLSTRTLEQPLKPAVPAAKPTVTTIVSSGEDFFEISWKEKNAGDVSYIISASLSSSSLTETFVSSAVFRDPESLVDKISTAIVSGLTPNTKYWVSVRAFKPEGLLSDFSSPDSGWTLARAPSQPTAMGQSLNSFLLSWSPEGNPVGTVYEVTMSLDNFQVDFSTPIAFSEKLTQTQTLITNIWPAVTYHLRVRARNANNVSTPYSPILSFALAAPIQITTMTINSQMDQVIESGAGAATLFIPQGALPQGSIVYVSNDPLKNPIFADPARVRSALEHKSEQRVLENSLREFAVIYQGAPYAASFTSLIRLQMNSALITTAQEGERFVISRWDDSSGEFEICPESIFDPISKTASCNIEHFSVYALMALPKPLAAAEDAYAYPIPWRPNDGDPSNGDAMGITFDQLPVDGVIEIYDLTTYKVRTLNVNVAAKIIWDGKNDEGDIVASGVYLWLLKSATGAKTGKLMIIR